ncbi:MAG: FAD-dependent oxidoreductase [Bacilli bacterium]|nr:FAD-dependent oxidoreductase [Bacilli bacterium]MBN2696786.1 FAD-dependent oxidoreductase [Bacilli bacterium]
MINLDQLVAEASRCLDCKDAPCIVNCPAHNNIPEFMKLIRTQEFRGARDLWHETSNIPELCGLLCPQELLCEGHCTLNKIKKPLRIGFLEAEIASLFKDVTDYPTASNGKRHLVIGLGPAGIANALRMAELGYVVEAIDGDDRLGGAIYHFVPDFRFDKETLKVYEKRFADLKIKVRYNTIVGKDVFLDDLIDDYDSVFIAMGLDLPIEVDIEHEDVRVHYAIDLLNHHWYSDKDLSDLLGSKVGIVGLGNVAIDISRVLAHLGKEVHIIYRRTMDVAPASHKEISEAIADGVLVHELLGPVAFRRTRDKKILDCEKNCIIKDPAAPRGRIEALPGETVAFELDDLVFATGQKSSDLVLKGSNVRLTPENGCCTTSNPKVFVGGDRVNKDKRIVDAMVSGIEVANKIAKIS